MIKQCLRLIKCHFNFCFNKISYILLLSLSTVSIVYNYLVLDSIDLSNSSSDVWQSYLESSLSFFVFLSILFAIIVFSYSFLTKQDSYLSYLVSLKITKLMYFYTKIITILIFVIIFLVMLAISFFIPIIFFNKLYIDSSVLMSFLDALKVMVYYGLISLLLVLTFDNMYVAIIPIVIFIFSTNITLFSDKTIEIFSFIIPIFDESYILINKEGIMFLTSFIILVISSLIYYYKD